MRDVHFPLVITELIAKHFYSKCERADSFKNNWIHYKKCKTAKLIYQKIGIEDSHFPTNLNKLVEEGYLYENEKKLMKIFG
jgi:hypothetical protein